MEANLNTAGAVNSGAGKVPVLAPTVISKDSAASDTFTPIQSLKALKLAEMKGDHIPVSEEQLIKAIDRAIKAAEGTATSLEFSVHDKTKEIMVKVIEKDTGKIIREIPPEKTLDLVAKLWEMAGIMVDERR